MLPPALLPMKESVQGSILEAAAALQPYFAEITAAWRQRMFEEFMFEGRAMVALERLNLGVGFALFSHSDFRTFNENLFYYGTRLAKLNVDTRAVARSLDLYTEFAEPHLHRAFGERAVQMVAALETLSSAEFVVVSGAYFDTQKSSSDALLKVLDAELSAKDAASLLERVLEVTTATFNASLGIVLLRKQDAAVLEVAASYGLDNALPAELEIPVGYGFSGRIAQTGESAILSSVAGSEGLLNPLISHKAQALWGVPLRVADETIGVLIIGFEKPYSWLPTEAELFRAIADRSALAIDRARMTDAVRERERRIVELSGHLLKAQEDERKRISRELHDETGQALMVIRLYLGMLDTTVTTRAAKAKIVELLEVVDRTIEGIRRIIARLSPLVLQELGLVAAIRKEAKDLARATGIHARVEMSDEIGRLSPDIEAAVYRVVQESLHNVAKYAQAKAVNVAVAREDGVLRVTIEDDGVGISSTTNPQRRSYGLAGMRERVSALGGTLTVNSRKGQGTKISASVPVTDTDQEFAEHRRGPVQPIKLVRSRRKQAVGTGTTE
jgi:signal transduction histidine kinase